MEKKPERRCGSRWIRPVLFGFIGVVVGLTLGLAIGTHGFNLHLPKEGHHIGRKVSSAILSPRRWFSKKTAVSAGDDPQDDDDDDDALLEVEKSAAQYSQEQTQLRGKAAAAAVLPTFKAEMERKGGVGSSLQKNQQQAIARTCVCVCIPVRVFLSFSPLFLSSSH